MAGAPHAVEVMTVRLHIRGRVQGVGYRAWCVHTARRLGLQGWVRNVTDGSVEALARGTKDAVDSLIAAARRGPPSAEVIEVAQEPVDPSDRVVLALAPGFHEAATFRP